MSGFEPWPGARWGAAVPASRCCMARAFPWQSHAEQGGQALGRRASASRRHYKLCLRCVAGARRPNARARDCTPPAMAGTHGAPQRSTTPATTGCPAARRACAPFVSITIRTFSGSTTLATKLLKTASNSPQKNNHVTCMTHTHSRPALSAARATSVMRDCCNLEFLFQITINARRSSPTCRAHGVGGRQTLDAAVAGIADTA